MPRLAQEWEQRHPSSLLGNTLVEPFSPPSDEVLGYAG